MQWRVWSTKKGGKYGKHRGKSWENRNICLSSTVCVGSISFVVDQSEVILNESLLLLANSLQLRSDLFRFPT